MSSRISRFAPWCAAAVAILSLSSFASATVDENGVLVVDVGEGSENIGFQFRQGDRQDDLRLVRRDARPVVVDRPSFD